MGEFGKRIDDKENMVSESDEEYEDDYIDINVKEIPEEEGFADGGQ